MMCFPQVMFSCVPAVALVWVLQVVGYPNLDFSYILAVVQIFFPPHDRFSVPGTIHVTVFLYEASTFCIYPLLLSSLVYRIWIVVDKQTL